MYFVTLKTIIYTCTYTSNLLTLQTIVLNDIYHINNYVSCAYTCIMFKI